MGLFKNNLSDIDKHLVDKVIELLGHENNWYEQKEYIELNEKYGNYDIKIYLIGLDIKCKYTYKKTGGWAKSDYFTIKLKIFSKEYRRLKKALTNVWQKKEELKK